MQVIDVQQNTDNWLFNRKKIIGGSEVAAIMGVSKFASPLMVWKDKMNPSIKSGSDNWIFEKGHRMEDIARAKFELHQWIDFPPLVVRHPKIEFCQVSLDGCNQEAREQVEIKYLGKADYENLSERKIVPAHYLPQIQYQLIATGYDFSWFVGINDEDKISFTKVYPDKELMIQILKDCTEFYNHNMKKEIPPPITDMDSIEISDKRLMGLIKEVKKLKSGTKAHKEKRAEITPLLPHVRCHFDGYKITHLTNKSGKKTLRITG